MAEKLGFEPRCRFHDSLLSREDCLTMLQHFSMVRVGGVDPPNTGLSDQCVYRFTTPVYFLKRLISFNSLIVSCIIFGLLISFPNSSLSKKNPHHVHIPNFNLHRMIFIFFKYIHSFTW